MSFSHQKGDCNHSQHQQPKQEYGDLTLQETVELHPQQQQQGFDDLLWDELKNEQSREIQQHNHRLYNSRSTGTAAAAAAAASSGVQNSNRYNPPMYNYHNHHHHYPHHHYPTNHHPSLETFRQSLEPLHENLKPIANALSTAANMASTAAQDQYQRILQTAQERRRTQQEAEAYAGPYRLGARRGRSSSRRGVEGVAATGAANENLEEFGLQGFQSSSVGGGGGGDLEDGGVSTNPLLNEYDTIGMGTSTMAGSMRDEESKNPFLILNNFRLAPKREGWEAVANLDLFFTSLYNYYHYKGLIPIVGRGLVELISLFFTLGLSVFLFVFLDWRTLATCRDENSCQDLGHYIIAEPFRTPSLWNFFVIIYILLFSTYGVYSIVNFFSRTREALEAKYVFEDKLGISAAKLEGGAVEWHQVVSKLLDLQKNGEFRVAIHGYDSMKDELVISQRILRRENFMVAFFNLNMLDLTIPVPRKTWLVGGGFRRTQTKFYAKSLEWSIYFCVLNYMFNHKYEIRSAFYADPVSLQRRFRLCGVIHAVLTPFILCFMTWHFFMQNVYDFNSSEQYLGPKEWSNVAKWTFREFNELPHAFERRLGPSYEAAEEYLKLFAPSAIMNTLGRVLMFLSGSLGFIALLLGALNDAILLHVKVGNWNLLWYVGIIAAIYSVGKSLIPDSDIIPRYHHNLFADMDSALMKVTSHTHYYPEYWKKRGWDDVIKSAFCELFQNKVKLFVIEFLSVIVAPVVLCVSLPPCAWDICSFIENVKVEVPGTGEHCGYATFDFDRFEDENWEGQKMGVDPSNSSVSAFQNQSSPSRHKARHGKMEKSFFNFKTVHPEWKCSSSGQDLVDRMSSYQHQQALAVAKERQLHISAAARQLEMLRKLEEKGAMELEGNEMDEQYLRVNLPVIESETFSGERNSGPNEKGLDQMNGNSKKDELSATPVNASTLNYDDLALSTELQNILNHSTLDAETLTESLLDPESSLMPLSNGKSREIKLQKQYMLLEKYHDQAKLNQGEISEDARKSTNDGFVIEHPDSFSKPLS